MRPVVYLLLLAGGLSARNAGAVEAGPGPLKAQTVEVKCAPKPGGEKADLKMELLRLPPGKIVLKDKDGKEQEHAVKAIWMGRTEVTWDQYDIFWKGLDLAGPSDVVRDGKRVDGRTRPSKPYEPPDMGWGHDGYPAMRVSRLAAEQFCAWLTAKTGKRFRLPTEAEWEYACRADGPPVKPDAKALDKVAWYAENAVVGKGGDAEERTHPVAKKEPNAWGFYDMLGNVAEHVVAGPGDRRGVVAGGSF